jgi:DNA repair exonuclease SbcCD ATPase subunit
MNVKIFERFRHACDEFFRRKGEFFKLLKDNMSSNLDKKKALCEQAEALKDSTDWKATSEILVKLQKDWKTIGPVSKKHSDAVWNRFITACDYFFDKKNQATSSQRVVEQENLKKKKEIIARLNAIADGDDAGEAESNIKSITAEWNSIGHVPFKEKDKVYAQYRAALDKIFDKHNISAANKDVNSFISNINAGDSQSLYRERERLNRQYENMRNELQTYQNNIGFLNSSSKKGNSLVTELNRKVEKLKSDLEVVSKKIKAIDDSIKE